MTFTLTPQPILQAEEQEINDHDPVKLNVLIIDVEKQFKSELSGLLRSKGHLVSEAETGDQGLEFLNNNKYDLLFLDYCLPERNSLEVLKEIKDKFPGIEVVIVCKHSDTHSVLRAMTLGAFDYIEKPLRHFDIHITLERIDKFLRIHEKITQVEESNTNIKKNLEELLRNPLI